MKMQSGEGHYELTKRNTMETTNWLNFIKSITIFYRRYRIQNTVRFNKSNLVRPVSPTLENEQKEKKNVHK